MSFCAGNRIVALKVLPGSAFAAAGFRARFQREAETAARLKHPGLAAVHEVGQAMGQPFISMDFIDGPSLAERLAESRMTAEFAAHLLREVARDRRARLVNATGMRPAPPEVSYFGLWIARC